MTNAAKPLSRNRRRIEQTWETECASPSVHGNRADMGGIRKGPTSVCCRTRRPSAATAARHGSMAGIVPAIGHAAAPIGMSSVPCARTVSSAASCAADIANVKCHARCCACPRPRISKARRGLLDWSSRLFRLASRRFLEIWGSVGSIRSVLRGDMSRARLQQIDLCRHHP